MFKLAPERKNREIAGSLHHLQSAGYAGIFIPVKTHMKNTVIKTVGGFPAFCPKYVSLTLGCISQVLRSILR
jgi:hypothetical protein